MITALERDELLNRNLTDALVRAEELEVQLRRKDRQLQRLRQQLKESQCPETCTRPTRPTKTPK